jgi:hypothetical protein
MRQRNGAEGPKEYLGTQGGKVSTSKLQAVSEVVTSKEPVPPAALKEASLGDGE